MDDSLTRSTVLFCFVSVLCKGIEVAAESLPSSLVQVYAIMMSAQSHSSNIASVSISIFTIAFSATTICFDFDLDPIRRDGNPSFYGYIPNNQRGRNVVMFSMFLYTTSHVAVRMLGIAALATVNPNLVVAVLGGDMFVFFVFKILRDDLRYWMKLDGLISWVLSFVMRAFAKVLVDFTSIVQFRVRLEIYKLFLSFNALPPVSTL